MDSEARLDKSSKSWGMIVIRILSSIFPALLGLAILAKEFYRAVMPVFEPGRHYDTNASAITGLAIIIFTLVPAVAIWIPRRIALIVGGVVLLPYATFALFLFLAIPRIGLFALIPLDCGILERFASGKGWNESHRHRASGACDGRGRGCSSERLVLTR